MLRTSTLSLRRCGTDSWFNSAGKLCVLCTLTSLESMRCASEKSGESGRNIPLTMWHMCCSLTVSSLSELRVEICCPAWTMNVCVCALMICSCTKPFSTISHTTRSASTVGASLIKRGCMSSVWSGRLSLYIWVCSVEMKPAVDLHPFDVWIRGRLSLSDLINRYFRIWLQISVL